MKHIVLFSGGAASSYCAYLVLQKEKKEDVILLRARVGKDASVHV